MTGDVVPPDEDPLRLKHIRLIRILMLSVAIWPENAILGLPRKFPFYTLFHLTETSILATGQIIYLLHWFKELNFFVLGNIYITMSLTFVTLFREFLPFRKKYGDLFREFLTKFHLRHFRNKDVHVESIYLRVDRISTFFTMFTFTLSMSGAFTFNAGPLFTNYRAGQFRDNPPENLTLQFAIHYEYPGFRQEKHVLLSFILNIWFCFVCAFLITILDLFVCLVVFQIIGHLRYLRTTLKHFPRPKEVIFSCGVMNPERTYREELMVTMMQDFNKKENEIIQKKFVDFIQHHKMVVNFTAEISNFFGPMLAINYLLHLFSLSIMLVECLQGGDAYMRYGSLTLMTFSQLTQLSVIFEVVHSESEKLKDDVYFVPWEAMSVRNQKSVCFLLNRMQRPIAVTALGLTAVGVTTMGKILKTSFSYCAFLKTLE